MGNLSKKQRDKMIEFINKLRNEHTDDTSAKALNEIESFIQNSQYGLIWEEHSEKVDEALKTQIPVFTELKERKINRVDKGHYNFLLEGDHKNKDAIVLDFFAGSGTTGQATLHANLEDGGNRRFILCTDNENNICEEVTYKRISDVILTTEANIEVKEKLFEQNINMTALKKSNELLKDIDIVKKENKANYDKIKVTFEDNKVKVYGITKIKSSNGIPANLKYFRTSYVDKYGNEDLNVSDELLNHITEMIELDHHIDVDGVKNIVVYHEEELEKKIREVF